MSTASNGSSSFDRFLVDDSGEKGWCFGPESVEQALKDIADGKFIVVVDDADRENEGDLILAADKATPESIAFMVRHTSGVICVSMEEQNLKRLKLQQMVPDNEDPKQTAFTVSVDYKHNTSTGISAADRAKTITALADPSKNATDFNRPGHIFPLRYRDGGVLKRMGHTEAAVDFARLAGCAPVGVLCEIVNDSDGSMSRVPELEVFCKQHQLTMTSIADLVRYRRRKEKLVERVGESFAKLPTRHGVFNVYAYRSLLDDEEHVALVLGGPFHDQEEPVLVRVHSECCTGDVFGSLRCDCGPQLEFALQKIAQEKRGVLVYLRGQEGRGIGLAHKMRAYALQDEGRDTVEANEDLGLPVDKREYGVGAQILADLGVGKMQLMTNNPAKYTGLSGYGLEIAERVQVQIAPNAENLKYLRTKKDKMGHWLDHADLSDEEIITAESDLSDSQPAPSIKIVKAPLQGTLD
eukprot:CAMPEP_0182444462 /NCGR_PEP_ID=MMETSP1172-20130603/2908_1 /TAXON_ID=708627 /ORGANISM="Timspurckia oligopyrenoides, Strain CCMP3278" /LENGTH=466 /DNA_ID=CAMNT_0024640019 /DNA_START=1234 /DNA_END=2634 /DNA_ORIENTATION=+